MQILDIENAPGKIVGIGNLEIGILRCHCGRLTLASPDIEDSDEDLRKFTANMAHPGRVSKLVKQAKIDKRGKNS